MHLLCNNYKGAEAENLFGSLPMPQSRSPRYVALTCTSLIQAVVSLINFRSNKPLNPRFETFWVLLFHRLPTAIDSFLLKQTSSSI